MLSSSQLLSASSHLQFPGDYSLLFSVIQLQLKVSLASKETCPPHSILWNWAQGCSSLTPGPIPLMLLGELGG